MRPVERETVLCFNLPENFVASPFEHVTVRRLKGGELRGGEHLIEGKEEAGDVDLVNEEILKTAVRGRCLHDVGHFDSERVAASP